MTQHKNDSTTIVAMFFIGAAVGAFMAAMLTPKTGDDLRQTIRRRVRQTKDKAEEAKENLQDQAAETLESAKQSVRRSRSTNNSNSSS